MGSQCPRNDRRNAVASTAKHCVLRMCRLPWPQPDSMCGAISFDSQKPKLPLPFFAARAQIPQPQEANRAFRIKPCKPAPASVSGRLRTYRRLRSVISGSPRLENGDTKSAKRPSLRSLSERTAFAELTGQSMASVGSFHARPWSHSGAYSHRPYRRLSVFGSSVQKPCANP